MRSIKETAERAGAGLPVTRAEAEAVVRGIVRTCRGLAILSVEKMRELGAAWQDARVFGDWESAHQVTAMAEGLVGIKGAAVEPYDWENLWRRAATAIFAHGDTVGKPCGHDVNDIICAGPFDGKQHERVCPKCGAKDSYGAPLFEIEDANDAT